LASPAAKDLKVSITFDQVPTVAFNEITSIEATVFITDLEDGALAMIRL